MNASHQPSGTGPDPVGTTYSSPGASAPQTPPSAPGRLSGSYAFDPRRKSPALATCLSVAPGLGQIYIGYYVRGFVHAITVAVLITILAQDPGDITPLLGLFLAFFWLYNIVDAGRRAALYNQAIEGGQPIELPSDVRVPRFAGSVAGGLALVGISLVLLSNTALGFSLRWVEDWWPLAPLGVGVYLIVRAIQDRAQQESEERG